jgi:hypothetical protein
MLENGKQREADEEAAKEEPKIPEEKNSASNYSEKHSRELMMHSSSLKGRTQTPQVLHQFPGPNQMLFHGIKKFIIKRRR